MVPATDPGGGVVTAATAAGTASTHGARRWVVLGVAAVVWASAYQLNLRWWNWVIYSAVGLRRGTRVADSVHFFFFDVTKIALLLTGVIFVVTVLRSFMSVERTRALLGGRREGVGNVLAAGLGVVTPFCSCSAVPAFIGFVAAGVPLGVTLSFLIASPLVNEVAIVLLFGLFGWKVTAMYVAGGVVIAIVAGSFLGRLRLERWVEPFVFETRLRGKVVDPSSGLSWDDRLAMGREEVVSILRKIWPYLLVGIGLGAVLHGWVPANWFGRADGHGPGLHDERRRALDTRADPAPPGPQAAAHRHLLRGGRRRDPRHGLRVQSHHLKGNTMDIKILGSGCAKCQTLESLTRDGIAELGLDAAFEHVTDPAEIASWGVMSTPALVIDDEVVLSGRVPSATEVRELLADR